MNELQQVLLIFSIVVIAGLYFLSRSRQNSASSKQGKPKTTASSGQTDVDSRSSVKSAIARGMSALLGQTSHKESSANEPDQRSALNQKQSAKHSASEALNELGEPHIPLSRATEERLHIAHEPLLEINPNQLSLPLGEEFELLVSAQLNPVAARFDAPSDSSHLNTNTQPSLTQPNSVQASGEFAHPVSSSTPNNPPSNHYVLVVDDPGLNGTAPVQMVCESEKPSFGIPKDQEGRSPGISSGVKKNHEVYVLLVLSGATDFAMPDVNQALLGAGLSFSPKLIYVKNDTMGGEIIRIANLLEPGTFPTENLAHFTTPGIAMILELPTTVRAPRAMDDLIMMGRKVSQRLNGRLYNMERQLIKESDLQAMREAAIAYESSPL